MPSGLHQVPSNTIITGWDFSTGSVKCLAFDLSGKTLAEVRLGTDLWHGDPVEPGRNELNLLQLEGQARATTRAMAARLRELGRLNDWRAGGISATHHSAGRIDADHLPVRRAICWNDHTLAEYHKIGLKRLGGQKKVAELIGGPWAIRYSLSHLVKDEAKLSPRDWKRTTRMLLHGPLAAGYLTGNFDVTSVSSAASTGILDFRRRKWRKEMLGALADPEYRKLAWKQLPTVIDHFEPIGSMADHVALEAGIDSTRRPLIFPTSDDQQAGLVGGGAVDDGQMAIILGNSAVVNSSSKRVPESGNLDVMCLNWGPYLWMRCYNNGAQFIDRIVGADADWKQLEKQSREVPAGCDGASVMPFTSPEPSLKVSEPCLSWSPREPKSPGVRCRASLEALAFLIALGVREHERAGQKIERITVSGGIARSDLMCEILASVLGRPLERLASDEGPALGAAVTALAAYETYLRRQLSDNEPFTVADAVQQLVRFRGAVQPNAAWQEVYRRELKQFERRLPRR
jgi:xylulokinase